MKLNDLSKNLENDQRTNLNLLKKEAQKNRKGGRPRKKGPLMTEKVTVYFTPEEKERIQRILGKYGIPIAQMLRQAGLEKLKWYEARLGPEDEG